MDESLRSFLKRIGSFMLVGTFTTLASKFIARSKPIEATCVGMVAAATTSVTLLGFNNAF